MVIGLSACRSINLLSVITEREREREREGGLAGAARPLVRRWQRLRQRILEFPRRLQHLGSRSTTSNGLAAFVINQFRRRIQQNGGGTENANGLLGRNGGG
jgi:hypothetical protein